MGPLSIFDLAPMPKARCGCVLNCADPINKGVIMRQTAAVLVLLFVAVSLFAVDAGRAEGALNVGGTRIPLTYAYVIDHQKNGLTNKTSDTKIILTDKPLPENTKLDDVDYNFPEGILGVVVCVTGKDDISHVVVQHPSGTYDGGFFENVPDYHFKRVKGDRGVLNGTLSSKKVKTNTMEFSFEADFSAQIQ